MASINEDELRVVVVDDDPIWTKMMTEALTKAGVQFRCINDSRTAMKEILTFGPNIILLDINMPDLSGKDVVNQLVANEKTQHIAIAFVTASENINEIMHNIKAHVVSVYHKPISISLLLRDIMARHWLINQKSYVDKLNEVSLKLVDKYAGSSRCALH